MELEVEATDDVSMPPCPSTMVVDVHQFADASNVAATSIWGSRPWASLCFRHHGWCPSTCRCFKICHRFKKLPPLLHFFLSCYLFSFFICVSLCYPAIYFYFLFFLLFSFLLFHSCLFFYIFATPPFVHSTIKLKKYWYWRIIAQWIS